MDHTTKSAKETAALAKKFAKELTTGQVIGLIGNLGAGKTTFTQGFADGLGVKQKITSPTFVFMKVYPANHKTIKTLVHIDAYRIKSAADLEAIGATEYFDDPTAVVLIEWADIAKKLLPKNTKLIYLTSLSEQMRIIKI